MSEENGMAVCIKKGLGADERFYVALDGVTLAVSKVTLFKLGLAFYHVAMGNRQLDGFGEWVDVPDLQVYRISSESSESSNRQDLPQTPTPRWVSRALFETRPGERLLAILERGLGLAVVEAGWLAD